jgi:hypothetical protein
MKFRRFTNRLLDTPKAQDYTPAMTADSPIRHIPFSLRTDYCHHGVPLSNGVFGALVWFSEGELRITFNRGDFWDRRGGTAWSEDCTYENIRRLLERSDFEEVRKLFSAEPVNGKRDRPTRLPLGRLDLGLRPGWEIQSAMLDTFHAEAIIGLGKSDESGDRAEIRISALISRPILLIEDGEQVIEKSNLLPASDFELVAPAFAARGIAAAEPIPETRESNGIRRAGFIQHVPQNPNARVEAIFQGETILLGAELVDPEDESSTAAFIDFSRGELSGLVEERRAHWAKLMERVPEIELGDVDMERMYLLGLYKMLGNSMPGQIAPSLQGPWVEEHRLPPWSSDYHFNINVQECLWPAYASGLWETLQPLFDMLESWKPVLRARAKQFVGIEDGLQLSHACDDRGTTMGGFWTGAVDHANTSWVAQMMWLYYRYSGDRGFLERTAVPFLRGSFRVFYEMVERSGGRLRIPLSVSPEYGGEGDDAWGANSSFFLVNIRFLCETLEACRSLLPDSEFARDEALFQQLAEMAEGLPAFTTGGDPAEIYLWEGRPLAESHRHHSHLAGIYPFDTIDPSDADTADIVKASYRRWARMGMGIWSGWSMPWASILHGRLGSPEMAVMSLKLFREMFTMPGYGTRHNATGEGFTVLSGGDIMQLEAGIAYSAAILELCVSCIRGRIRVGAGLPASMPNVRFGGIYAEGGFRLSGKRVNGRFIEVTVDSLRGEELRMEPFWNDSSVKVFEISVEQTPQSGEEVASFGPNEVGRMPTRAGERYIFRVGA